MADRSPPWDPRGWRHGRSLASRVTLLTTFAVGLAVAVVALAVYATVRVQMQSTLDQSLLDRAQQAADSVALSQLAASEVPSWALGAADVRILFLTADGASRSADDLPALRLGRPELAVAAGARTSSVRTVDSGDERYRVVAVPSARGEALVIAQSLAPQELVLAKLGVVMLLVGAAGVVAAGLAGWAVARNGLRPVRRLTTAAEEIARTERLVPLRVEGEDEIARLAGAFNEMLVALAASRDRQRQLVADAGHELRTPLTSLRTNIDLLMQADSAAGARRLPAEARGELLEDVRAQAEELTTLVGDLVELAREEAPRHVVAPVDLAEVVDRAVARVRRRATDKSFTVDAAPWWVTGDGPSLERAVTNLLDNAAKWGSEGGTVAVRLHDGLLVVDDDGPGIAEGDRPHVFERFWRSAEARALPGSGLGLAIVGQIVTRHAGTVEVDSSPAGGARLAVRLPGTELPPAALTPPARAAPRAAARPSTATRPTPPRRSSAR